MRYAVFFTFDDKTEAALQALREAIAENVPGVPPVKGKMGPHMTLAVFDSGEQNGVFDCFHALSPNFRSIALTLHGLGSFPGRRKVLFAEPMPSREIQACYERCHVAFSAFSKMVVAYHDPVKWHPHVTLTKGIGGHVFQQAYAFAKARWQPLNAVTRSLSLIDVQKPMEFLVSHGLTG